MWRNFSSYSLSVKSQMTLLFEINKGFDRSARLAWKFIKLGKISRATICLRVYNVISFNCHRNLSK